MIYLSGIGIAVATPSYQVPTLQLGLVGPQLILSGTGTAAATYRVLSATNPAQPTTAWDVLTTQTFDANGKYSWTNTLDAATSQRFFRLAVP